MQPILVRAWAGFLPALLVFACSLPSRAATFLDDPDCAATADPASCNHLTSFLQILYVVAAILGVLLLAVILIAVVAWRKNKRSELDKH